MVKLLSFSLSVMVHQPSCENRKEKQNASAVEGASVSQELTAALIWQGHIIPTVHVTKFTSAYTRGVWRLATGLLLP
jgi:hypothetical protein